MLTVLADLTVPAAVSLGIAAVALLRLVMAFADADLSYFDPRWHLARLVESGRIDAVLVTVGPALVAIRNALLDAAALVLMLATRPKGPMAA